MRVRLPAQILGAGVLSVAVLASLGTCRWVQVGSWTGNGDRATESFRVSASEWKVSWQLRSIEPDSSLRPWIIFRVLDSAGQGVGYVFTYDTWGETYVRADPGDFHLEISGGLYTEWTVIALDCALSPGCTGR